mgnify:CR=1 FL=1
MINIIFILIAVILIFIVVYRNSSGKNVYKYLTYSLGPVYDKIAPYTYKEIRKKIKDLGQNYKLKDYISQVVIFGGLSFGMGYLYFYDISVSIIYALVAICFIPYLEYLRCKRLYSEFIFEQLQTYTTNIILDFQTSQSFVKSLEGVYESGVLENPIKQDVKVMIDMAYKNGTINESLEFFQNKYDFYMVKNMHQLFLQITNEGAKDSSESLENMSLDIDMLVEAVYRDRIERANFHKKFIRFGVMLYGMIALVQLLLGDTYSQLLNLWYLKLLIHLLVVMNSYFLLRGEKYYNENVGAE